jgi:hypothetical protein
MRLLLTISFLLFSQPSNAESIRLLIQRSPLAGSQYYALGEHWSALRVGDPLELIREPNNRHDRQAIRVEWRGHQLGYVPRAANSVIAAALDAGDPLRARISRLTQHPDPWRRVEFEVLIEL